MYCREDGTPYYIGKGRGDRIHSNRHTINLPPVERRKFLKTNLTEEESFRHERYMISILGRKDQGTGILRNHTDGGEGGSGQFVSEKTRKLMSEKKKMSNNPRWRGGISLDRNKYQKSRRKEKSWNGIPLSKLTPEQKEERKWEIYDKRFTR